MDTKLLEDTHLRSPKPLSVFRDEFMLLLAKPALSSNCVTQESNRTHRVVVSSASERTESVLRSLGIPLGISIDRQRAVHRDPDAMDGEQTRTRND